MAMTSSASATTILWHTLPVETVFSRLSSAPHGLTGAEAHRRLAEHGPNELQAVRRVSPSALFFGQFKNVLIVILLVATALSALLGHAVEAIAIAAIVLLAVVLGFVQEYRAERALEALQQMAAPEGTVIRDGEENEVPARDLVPGDVILLRAGDRVPADARLVEAVNLQVDEAALTGESVPVEKQTTPLAAGDVSVGDRTNMVHAGTAVTYGRGRGVIVATGMQTEFGKIAQVLQAVETTRTPLQESLDRMGHVLARAAFAVVIVIVALGLFRGQPFIEMLIFGIALAVAAVPEALPAVVTISLAIGVERMVKRHALVRRLAAVETLGSTSVICSDKTGTLTKGEMTVRKIWVLDQAWSVSGAGYEPRGLFSCNGSAVEPTAPVVALLRAAVLACDAYIVHSEADGRWHVKGDPTEGALVVAAAKAGVHKTDLDAEMPRANEIPFTSEGKRMTTVHATPAGPVAYSKGAPEVILGLCERLVTERGEDRLDAGSRESILLTAHQMASEALRVLAVAVKSNATLETAEDGMTFLGLVGMIDPPRPEARPAVATCEQAGIKVRMITGDHPLTAQAVAREVGILKAGRVVAGAELETMSDEALEDEVDNIEVYARVSPVHKLRVVTALQKRGQIVAMTGDGVNDAPALKKADIGVAMGITGTDVTKEAAAMTLTDDNFASIVAAVEEGRGLFGNIKKYLMYLLSCNVGEIGLMAGTSLLGLPLPLTAVQVLYVNLATDGLPALALAVDPPESNLMRRPPRNHRSGIFTRPVVTLMAIAGVWTTVINLGLFAWALRSGHTSTEAMTLTFVALVLIQFFNAYNFRSDRYSALHHPFANKWLNLAVGGQVPLLAVIVYAPTLQIAFNTYGMQPAEWLLVIALASTIVPVVELAKWMQRQGWFGPID